MNKTLIVPQIPAITFTTIPSVSGPQFAARLAQLFPRGWSSDDAKQTGNVYKLLLSFGNELAVTLTEVQYALAAQRLQTETYPELDDASNDFLDGTLPRLPGQSDASFSDAIIAALFQPAATRSALSSALAKLTGSVPRMMEPWNIFDTGTWRNVSYWNVDNASNPARWGNGGLRYQGYIETAPASIPAIGAYNPILCWSDSAYWNVPGYFLGIIAPVDENAVNNLIERLHAYGTVVWAKLVAPASLGVAVAPGIVSSLTAVPSGPNSVVVSWTVTTGTPPFTFQVLYRVSGTTTSTSTAPMSTNSVTITGLTSFTTYGFSVIARNAIGFSQSAFVTATTGVTPPSPAQNVLATQVQATAITVQWTPPVTGTPPFTYSIEYWVAGTTNIQTLAVGQSTTSVTIIGLAPNTTYDIDVVTSNTSL